MGHQKKEKRKHKRYSVDGIQGNVLYPADLEVLNISIDGAAVETMKRLDINREYTFKIKHKDALLSLKGRVMWALLTNKEVRDTGKIIPVYRAGIKFTDTFTDKTAKLIDFIDENKVTHLERRVVGIRFKINTPEHLRVDYPYKYDVKKLSLSGMLVETEYPLEIDTRYNIELSLKEDMLSIVGRVAYCKEVSPGTDGKYDVGIEFIGLSDACRKSIRDFLKSV